MMVLIIRFIFGLAIGSFLNVLAVRYDPEKFLLTKYTLGGRSHCPHCKHKLKWYELIPVVSFAIQGGKCRSCRTKISYIYPVGELLAGFIFVFVPAKIVSLSYPFISVFAPQVIIWTAFFLVLLLLSLIDYRLEMVPDEGSFLLLILGILGSFAYPLRILGMKVPSFIGHYSNMFGFQDSILVNHLLGMVIAAAFFGVLILVTKGRGMGMGDLKLSLGLGFIFGWPDIAIVLGTAFVIGAAAGGLLLLFRRKTMKGAVPFVPFLAIGSALIFFFGYNILNAYFGFIGI